MRLIVCVALRGFTDEVDYLCCTVRFQYEVVCLCCTARFRR